MFWLRWSFLRTGGSEVLRINNTTLNDGIQLSLFCTQAILKQNEAGKRFPIWCGEIQGGQELAKEILMIFWRRENSCFTTTWCWLRGAAPAKATTGNNFPRMYQEFSEMTTNTGAKFGENSDFQYCTGIFCSEGGGGWLVSFFGQSRTMRI